MLLENRLVKEAVSGDKEALTKLLSHYYPVMLGIAIKRTQDPYSAGDIVQESCLHILEKIGQFRGDSKFKTWVSQIVVNTVLMYHRSNSRRRILPDEDLIFEVSDESPNSEQDLASKEFLSLVEGIVSRSSQDEDLIERHCNDGQRIEDIARETGQASVALRGRLFRIRGRLKEALDN